LAQRNKSAQRLPFTRERASGYAGSAIGPYSRGEGKPAHSIIGNGHPHAADAVRMIDEQIDA